MSVRGSVMTRPAALRADIQVIERRIRQRRDRIGAALGSMADKVRGRLTSPPALVAAGLFGAVMHSGRRFHGLRLLAILRLANAALRRAMTATSRSSANPG